MYRTHQARTIAHRFDQLVVQGEIQLNTADYPLDDDYKAEILADFAPQFANTLLALAADCIMDGASSHLTLGDLIAQHLPDLATRVELVKQLEQKQENQAYEQQRKEYVDSYLDYEASQY
ncbi:hypothetical protein QG087_08960 [Kingella kingae]|uniref:hypothetical protein n=1 Tax=Kingella kingae TaxID=504 RepID=UPI00254EE2C9|nr:hypothetical protein [Kingella kingae]MDK4631193.1 hypothetical protein [Kingella kingae]MDK4657082.1 hypothetical protein [Kingella kingae]